MSFVTSLFVLSIGILCFWFHLVLQSPFHYPYFIHEFNVSGKRGPKFEDYLDEFLISGGFDEIQEHMLVIEQWKAECAELIERSYLKNRRRRQYEEALDDQRAFQFCFVRTQTRYSQQNYVRTPYQVDVESDRFSHNFAYIKSRYERLEAIDFACPLRLYHSRNQRKLMTRELREKIMQRDNYTCQLCGKYMPDEVGLQVDHIIPVAKGGKSIESNLQVLCSKCNGSKSAKYVPPAKIRSRFV